MRRSFCKLNFFLSKPEASEMVHKKLNFPNEYLLGSVKAKSRLFWYFNFNFEKIHKAEKSKKPFRKHTKLNFML